MGDDDDKDMVSNYRDALQRLESSINNNFTTEGISSSCSLHDDVIAVIKEGLQLLRKLGDRYAHDKQKVRHPNQYDLSPPLDEDQVVALENRYHIHLPIDYRKFLLEIGNGTGTGAFWGLFPMGEMDDGWKFAPWPDYIQPQVTFPHTNDWNDVSIVDRGYEKPDREEFMTEFRKKKRRENLEDKSSSCKRAKPQAAADEEEEAKEAYDEFCEEAYEYYCNSDDYQKHQETYWKAATPGGAFPIAHHGCCCRDWLIVNGPEANHVWQDDSGNMGGVYPVKCGNRKRTTFLEWCLDYIHDEIKRLTGIVLATLSLQKEEQDKTTTSQKT